MAQHFQSQYYPTSLFSDSILKWIASFSMLIDHTGASVVLALYYVALRNSTSPLGVPIDTWYHLYSIMRIIGRIAFPIFCFCLVEGFCHSSDKAKYALRLGVFSLISEIPFDFALNNDIRSPGLIFLEFSSQNVFFTLFLGFCALWLADRIAHEFLLPLRILVLIGCALPFASIAQYLLSTDYGGFGVLLIAALMCGRLFDQYHNNCSYKLPLTEVLIGMVAIILWSVYISNAIEPYAVFGFIICLFYNGERGYGPRWFFYLFYPIHLLILGIITTLI